MAIIGNIIKGAIHLKKQLSPDGEDALSLQQNTLKKLLTKARDTAFGIQYGFEELLDSSSMTADFSSRVPIFEYNDIFEKWWYRTLNGEADICWPGQVRFFALSSGTTGSASKKIPVTDDMMKSIRSTSIQQILSLANFDLPAELFEKEILMLGSNTDLIKKEGHFEGEISGISAGNIPFWFETYYKPGKEISRIPDWEKRVHEIALKAPEWDIGALSGIPAWIQIMLERVIQHHGLKHIHEIWPNLALYATGGVAFGPYKNSLEKLFGREVYYIDTYLASEGFLAYQERPETHAMKLALDNGIYFEFVPFNKENFDEDGNIYPHAEAVDIGAVKTSTDYAIIISTCSGAWRYMIGDTVKFKNVNRHEIVITGRTKHFMNVAGSQLSVEKMNAAMKMLEKDLKISIKEFTVSAIPYQGGFAHKWYIGTQRQVDNRKVRDLLDGFLKKLNKNYRVAREKALKEVFVETIPLEIFYQWHKTTRKLGGQAKTPRMMKADQFSDWEVFVRTSLTTPA